MRLTPETYRLMTARYFGARRCSSVRHAESGTSTRNTPRENSSARVRFATTAPQVTGQANNGASDAGAFFSDPATIFSTDGASGSTRFLILAPDDGGKRD